MGKSTINHIFNSYVKLPEGIMFIYQGGILTSWGAHNYHEAQLSDCRIHPMLWISWGYVDG